jgi:hypothetical protein
LHYYNLCFFGSKYILTHNKTKFLLFTLILKDLEEKQSLIDLISSIIQGHNITRHNITIHNTSNINISQFLNKNNEELEISQIQPSYRARGKGNGKTQTPFRHHTLKHGQRRALLFLKHMTPITSEIVPTISLHVESTPLRQRVLPFT